MGPAPGRWLVCDTHLSKSSVLFSLLYSLSADLFLAFSKLQVSHST